MSRFSSLPHGTDAPWSKHHQPRYRSAAHPDATVAPSIAMASTEAEKEEIYRLRYQVYIEEMDGARRHTEADTASGVLRDEWDDRAYHFYARLGTQGRIIACARVLLRRDGPIECEDEFEAARLQSAFPDAVAMTSRLAVYPQFRAHQVVRQLTCRIFEFLCEQGVRYNFLDCHTRLLPLYSRLGFRAYRSGFNHSKYTYVIPMVLVVDDLAHLERVKSPFVPLARRYPSSLEGRRLLAAAFPAAGVALSDTDGIDDESQIIERLLASPGVQGSGILDGLSAEELPVLVSTGHVVACRGGDAVLRANDPGRELFLILDGMFRVEGRLHGPGVNRMVSKTLTAGDVFGEIRFLTEEIRYASVVAMDHGTLLVLNSKALDRLVITAPKVGAKVFRNLAKIVVDRLWHVVGSPDGVKP